MASTTRSRSALGRAALLASREACGSAHLSPGENGVCGILQGGHAAAQILDVVEVLLDRLTDVGEIRTGTLALQAFCWQAAAPGADVAQVLGC